jgi:hypothetical protein
MPRPLLAALALVASLAVTAQASATTRWASPVGSGAEPCNSHYPCTLKNAIENAPNDGDEVVLRTGDYTIGQTLMVDKKLNIHGEPGTPRPRLLPTQAFSGQTVYLYGNGPGEFRLSRLEIQSKSAALHVIGGPSFLQGLVLLGNGPSAAAALFEYDGVSVLRDTIARANGQGAVAVFGYKGPVHLRNVTAIATGTNATALQVQASCIPGPGGCMPPFADSLMVARNVIARGAGHDLGASVGGAGPKAEIDIGHSNFVTSAVGDGAKITDAGGNQTAAPLFANGIENWHEAAGSPTIDAGIEDPYTGATDYEGDSRKVGDAIDIGADEYVPPVLPGGGGGDPGGSDPGGGGGDPGGGDPGGGPAADTIAPVLMALAVAPAKFRAARGATIFYTASEQSALVFRVERRVAGRKIKGRCVKPSKRNRRHRKCRRFVRLKGRFSYSGTEGANAFKFDGRLKGKRLEPGRYRLVAVANDATGNKSKPRRARFSIKR